MTSMSPPRTPPRSPERPRHPQVRWNSWNFLLFIPLLALLTPVYNRLEPRLFGLPFFYWFQLFGVAFGVGATFMVYVMTRDTDYVVTDRPDLLSVDALDEGTLR